MRLREYVRYTCQFIADIKFNVAHGSVSSESAIVQFSSVIYCFRVLTQQHRDRRKSKYMQQTDTQGQQVIKNHK